MRKFLTVTALAAFVTGSAFLSASPASAATTLAGTCSGSVSGNMGDTVAIAGNSLSTIVQAAAKKNEIFLHLNGVDPAKLGSAIAARGTLTIGQVPNSAGGSIDGASIASVVTQSLQNEGALGEALLGTKAKTLQFIKDGVTSACGLTAIAGNYTPPTTPGAGGTGTPQGGTPGGTSGNLSNLNPGTAGGTGGSAPMRDYGGIPTATAGTAVAPGARYPANGTLPGDASAPQGDTGAQNGQGADIRDAGNAQSLSSPASSNDVQLPMLLAVIVLAGVTAGLVRTWVLRRAS